MFYVVLDFQIYPRIQFSSNHDKGASKSCTFREGNARRVLVAWKGQIKSCEGTIHHRFKVPDSVQVSASGS